MGSEEIRTEPGIGLASVQRWLSRQKLQAGLSVHPGAHFQPAALDPRPRLKCCPTSLFYSLCECSVTIAGAGRVSPFIPSLGV